MSVSVLMPALGESVTEGTVTRWLKQEGDHVELDEPLVEISTDKVDTEIPSPAAGVLQRIVASEDDTVEVGGELAVIGDGDAPADGDTSDDERATASRDDRGGADAAPEEHEPAADRGSDAGRESNAGRESDAGRQAGGGGSTAGGSSTPVTMPALGESVTEGTVTRWLKQVGDQVSLDEPLVEISTDKVDTEIPSPVAGTLLEIIAGEDDVVEVGGQLGLIGSADSADQPSENRPAEPQSSASPRSEPQASEPPRAEARDESPWREPGEDERAEARPAERSEQPAAARQRQEPARPAEPDTNGAGANGAAPYVTPLVRKLAAEHDVDLAGVRGTGVGGRIRKQDVLAAAEQAKEHARQTESRPQRSSEPAPDARPAAAPASSAPEPITRTTGEPTAADAAKLRGSTQSLSRLRRVIAHRMVESLRVSAQLTCMVEVDVTKVALMRQRAKASFEAREGTKLSFLPFFVKTAVDTLKLYPQINASIDTDKNEVVYHDAEHIGIAVDTNRGLLVPVLHNAGDLSLAGISRAIAELAERTRTNRILPDDLSGGTFTITNIGSRGALTDTPIINQPQVAILGTGAVVKRPAVVTDSLGQDTIAIRSIASLVLTYDHRLVDGADAARFLSSVKARMETAAFESELGL